jgi:hypothetical protein
MELICGVPPVISVVKSENGKTPDKYGKVPLYAKDIKYTFLDKTVGELFAMLFDSNGVLHIKGDLIVDGHVFTNNSRTQSSNAERGAQFLSGPRCW